MAAPNVTVRIINAATQGIITSATTSGWLTLTLADGSRGIFHTTGGGGTDWDRSGFAQFAAATPRPSWRLQKIVFGVTQTPPNVMRWAEFHGQPASDNPPVGTYPDTSHTTFTPGEAESVRTYEYNWAAESAQLVINSIDFYVLAVSYSGLILRDASIGTILRDARTGTILRDD